MGGAVVFVALAWLALFLSYGGSFGGFYKTVEEIRQAGAAQDTRVGGRVSKAGLVQDGDTVRFVLSGKSGAELPVVYRGAYPDRLGPYQEVVAAGSEGADGVFVATQVLVKCPGKYLPERVVAKAMEGTGLGRALY